MHPDMVQAGLRPACSRPAGLLLLGGLLLTALLAGCGEIKFEKRATPADSSDEESSTPAEAHLQAVARLTRGGVNRGACLGPDGHQVAWLQRSPDAKNDQIMLMDLTIHKNEE